MRRNILRLLGEDGRLTAKDISERIDVPAKEVQAEIRRLEAENVIIGYRAVFPYVAAAALACFAAFVVLAGALIHKRRKTKRLQAK